MLSNLIKSTREQHQAAISGLEEISSLLAFLLHVKEFEDSLEALAVLRDYATAILLQEQLLSGEKITIPGRIAHRAALDGAMEVYVQNIIASLLADLAKHEVALVKLTYLLKGWNEATTGYDAMTSFREAL